MEMPKRRGYLLQCPELSLNLPEINVAASEASTLLFGDKLPELFCEPHENL